MSTIPDFTTEEVNAVRETLKERFRKDTEVLLADTELRLDPGAPELTTCPALYWENNHCHFVISKLGTNRFHTQFYYRGSEQFGTGIREFDDIVDCTVTLLRVQADHELPTREGQ
jgi:hypothetical protein